MRNFIIEGKANAPSIHINEKDGFIEIKGSSAIKNPIDFYLDLVKWIYIFRLDSAKPKVVNIRLDNIDKSSARWMFLVIKQMEKMECSSARTSINWFYKLKNSRIYSIGDKYRSSVSLPFNMVTA